MKAPILRKETLAPGISRMVLSAPEVAAHAAAGQFIILRPTENGERIPLTISDFDPKAGTVTIVYQVVGGTTLLLDSLRPGDSLPTFTGPLGRPSHIAGFQNAAVIGGGLGCAIALPTAAALHRGGCRVTAIAGFRSEWPLPATVFSSAAMTAPPGSRALSPGRWNAFCSRASASTWFSPSAPCP